SVPDRIGDPDPVLLIDGEVERPTQLAGAILVRPAISGSAEELDLAGIAFRQIHDLIILKVERPDIAIGPDNYALHDAQLAAEFIPFRWRKRFTVLIEQRDRLASGASDPNPIGSIDRRTEARTFYPSARETCRRRRKRLSVRCEF